MKRNVLPFLPFSLPLSFLPRRDLPKAKPLITHFSSYFPLSDSSPSSSSWFTPFHARFGGDSDNWLDRRERLITRRSCKTYHQVLTPYFVLLGGSNCSCCIAPQDTRLERAQSFATGLDSLTQTRLSLRFWSIATAG